MPLRLTKPGREAEQGLTLVELIVVLTIISLMAAVAVPGITRLVSNRDTLSRESRQLFEMLSAARIYAATWNVRTAVVYNLDHYQSPVVNPDNLPLPNGDGDLVADSLNSMPVRYIESACMMYALPNSERDYAAEVVALKQIGRDPDADADLNAESAFVPMFGNEGNWTRFQDNICVPLLNPDEIQAGQYTRVYHSTRPRFNVYEDAYKYGVGALGMYPGLPVITDYQSFKDSHDGGAPLPERIQHMDRFVAHVFTPDGRLDSPRGTKERYTFYMTYAPNEQLDVRLTDPNVNSFIFPDETTDPRNPVLNLRVIGLEINRSTGRVKIAS